MTTSNNITVHITQLPTMEEVEDALINTLGGNIGLNRLGPAMCYSSSLTMSHRDTAILSDFSAYSIAQSDAAQAQALELLVYEKIKAPTEDAFIDSLRTSGIQTTALLCDFIQQQAQGGAVKYLVLGSALWNQLHSDVSCQRLMVAVTHTPWISKQGPNRMVMLPAIQGTIANYLQAKQALKCNEALAIPQSLVYAYDYLYLCQEIATGNFLVDYTPAINWYDPSKPGQLYRF